MNAFVPRLSNKERKEIEQAVRKELQDFYMAESSEETEFILLYKLKNEVGVDVRELNDMFEIECVIKD